MKVGDVVTNRDRSKFYTVRYIGPRAVSCEPLQRRPGRVATNMASPTFVRTAELERSHMLMRRARAYLDAGSLQMARTMAAQARTYLERASSRGDDGPGALVAAVTDLRRLYEEVRSHG